MNDPTSTDGNHLPDDLDLDVDQSRGGDTRVIHLHPISLVVVFVGGTLGTSAREGLSRAFPPFNGIPYATFGINFVGAFLLGVVLDALARRGSDQGRRRTLRLLVGTGFIGGFTTYSAVAADSASLIGSGEPGAGISYAIATVLVGAVATWGGIAVAAATHRPVSEAD
ncbi:fluoride efflux transporter FluC [Rothia uropygialis]|uniref:fluoride efflux transporter FluC n=1 Tax=Kocuria sp. 36 TaxID=1415402 RepID=UPI001876F560|nr:CrcB family protein [Kocuria sp. 36]